MFNCACWSRYSASRYSTTVVRGMGFYFQNWGTLYDQWMTKIRALIGEMEALLVQMLPPV